MINNNKGKNQSHLYFIPQHDVYLSVFLDVISLDPSGHMGIETLSIDNQNSFTYTMVHMWEDSNQLG